MTNFDLIRAMNSKEMSKFLENILGGKSHNEIETWLKQEADIKKNNPSKYIIIYVYEREITCLGLVDSEEEARKILKKDFMEVFLDTTCYKESDFDKETDKDEKWGFDNNDAWLNSSNNHDWKIIKID